MPRAMRAKGTTDQGWGALGLGCRCLSGPVLLSVPGLAAGAAPPPPRPMARGLFTPWSDPDDPRNRARRDPDYFWGGRFN